MDFPQVFVFDATDREDEAARELARGLAELEIEAPFLVCSQFGDELAAGVTGPRPPEGRPKGADQSWAAEMGHHASRSGADAIVAVGGGRCLDVAKLIAARAGLALIAVPTQLSHDGICSPVAVVPAEATGDDLAGEGTKVGESIGAVAPRAVFLSMPTLLRAPVESVRAGLGDLLANPLALRDWALAAERGLEETDQRAWDLSIESFNIVKPHLDADPSKAAREAPFLRELADALILSGTAMIYAGSSRPASGAEHEISHAIDTLHGGRAMHGAQVAFGCIISVALYGEDTDAFRDRLRRLGLPHHPEDLDLSEDDVVRLLLTAPDTRPGRFTILEDANLDEPAARRLIRRIWR